MSLPSRVLVTGDAGSGKTTLAAQIGAGLGLPVRGLDSVVWQSGWRKTPQPEKEAASLGAGSRGSRAARIARPCSRGWGWYDSRVQPPEDTIAASAPPGRLRAEGTMDRLTVELPTSFGAFDAAYAALIGVFFLLAAPLAAAGDVCGGRLWDAGRSQGLAVLFLAPWAYSRLFGRLVRRGSALPPGVRALLALVSLPPLVCLLAMTAERSGFFLSGVSDLVEPALASIAIAFAAAMYPAIRPPTLILDGARLEIRAGGRRRVFLLEAIEAVEERAGWRRGVAIDGRLVPGLRGLTAAERAWLAGRIGEAAQRRRAALARQGHDLAVAPAPPPALLRAARAR